MVHRYLIPVLADEATNTCYPEATDGQNRHRYDVRCVACATSVAPLSHSEPAHSAAFAWTAFSSTAVPVRMSSHSVNSISRWLIPSTLGTKIILVGVILLR